MENRMAKNAGDRFIWRLWNSWWWKVTKNRKFQMSSGTGITFVHQEQGSYNDRVRQACSVLEKW